jgi:hypothetical protein
MLGVLGPVLGYLRTKKINEKGYIKKNIWKILVPANGFSGILLQYCARSSKVFKNRHKIYGKTNDSTPKKITWTGRSQLLQLLQQVSLRIVFDELYFSVCNSSTQIFQLYSLASTGSRHPNLNHHQAMCLHQVKCLHQPSSGTGHAHAQPSSGSDMVTH